MYHNSQGFLFLETAQKRYDALWIVFKNLLYFLYQVSHQYTVFYRTNNFRINTHCENVDANTSKKVFFQLVLNSI